MSAIVTGERVGTTLVCRFRNPERHNAVDGRFWVEYLKLLDEAERDPATRAVVTASTGRSWCSGADPKMLLRYRDLDDLVDAQLGPYGREHPDFDAGRGPTALLDRFLGYSKPLIAAIDGRVAGGGWCIAMLHDIRIVSQTAKFTAAFVDLGLGTEMGLSGLLTEAVGAERAMELLLTGRPLLGDEAARIGMALRAVPSGLAEQEALELAAAIGTRSAAAVATMKRQVTTGRRARAVERADAEWTDQRALFLGPHVQGAIDTVARRMAERVQDAATSDVR
jgi:2-(1,2-epoxy-1,2-dihydrophenyl)acetyl-CoA isomerase